MQLKKKNKTIIEERFQKYIQDCFEKSFTEEFQNCNK